MNEPKELGACLAQIQKISTVVDGSIRITLDIPPNNQGIVANLIKKKMSANDLVAVSFVDPGE